MEKVGTPAKEKAHVLFIFEDDHYMRDGEGKYDKPIKWVHRFGFIDEYCSDMFIIVVFCK